MKKGFTLLELLAVIVVLAIIALIVTPFVTKAIENARKGAFKSSAYGIINAAEIYYASNMIKEEVTSKLFTITNGKFVSGEEELIFEGKAPTQGTVMIHNDGKISLNVSDGVYRAEKTIEQQEVSISLATAPSSDELAIQLEDLREQLQTLTGRLESVEGDNTTQNTNISTNATNITELIEIVNTNNETSNIFLKSHAVGSIYVTVATDENTISKMHDKYGGTWEAYGQGRVLIGAGTNNDGTESKTFAINSTGGKYNHTLTIAQMPSHRHNYGIANNGSGPFSGWVINNVTVINLTDMNVLQTAYTGSTQPHNNIQPYVTVYMWKRTA